MFPNNILIKLYMSLTIIPMLCLTIQNYKRYQEKKKKKDIIIANQLTQETFIFIPDVKTYWEKMKMLREQPKIRYQ